jgi:predicted transcriptional regulator
MPTTATPERVHVNAFVDKDVRDALERLARANDRSLSAELRLALREHVERDHDEEDAA